MKNLLKVFLSLLVVVGGGILVFMNLSRQPVLGSPPSEVESASLGKTLYHAQCAQCHGNDGKGNGIAALYLHPRPRDFTSGKYKFRSTESGSIPTDADIEKTILNGLHGTAMPDFKPFLRGDSLKAVVEYVKSLSSRFNNEQPKPVKIGSPILSSPASIASGKKMYEQLQCASCHGSDGTGVDAVAADFVDDNGRPIVATNLTEPWTFRGGATAQDVYLRFRTGIDGTPMPSYIGSASEKEMWDLANYVLSLKRKAIWEMNEEELNAHYAKLSQQTKQNPVHRGRYLVTTMGCGDCHSPINNDGSLDEQFYLAGGQKWDMYPFGIYYPGNLTPDKETGIGKFTDEQLKDVIRKGVTTSGRKMLPFPMPWPAYANMSDDDLNAVIAYLRSLPPVYNQVPEYESLNIFPYLWGKFRMLILKQELPAYIYPGNFGKTKQSTVFERPASSRQSGKEG
jgi:mono/diheme cytochrome c family protein